METVCSTRVFGDEMKIYLETMAMDAYTDQAAIEKEESSGGELQEGNSSSEEEEEEPEEEGNDNTDNIEDNDSSISYSSALTAMDWGLRSHPEYQEDYWIGNSGASSHMVGEDKDLFTKVPIQGKVNAAYGTPMPMVCNGKMNVEAIPKQGKSSKGVLTVKVANGLLHKLLSFTTALIHNWKMYGAKKENGDIEIKLTHQHFEPIVFDRVLRFDDAILLDSTQEFESGRSSHCHFGRKHFQENVTSSNRTCWTAANGRYSQVLWSECYRNSDKVFKLFFGKDKEKNIPKKE